jgi:hypothetical protein
MYYSNMIGQTYDTHAYNGSQFIITTFYTWIKIVIHIVWIYHSCSTNLQVFMRLYTCSQSQEKFHKHFFHQSFMKISSFQPLNALHQGHDSKYLQCFMNQQNLEIKIDTNITKYNVLLDHV